MSTAVSGLDDKMADLGAGIRQSLVQIRNGRRRAGAGTIWHGNGLILTNAHVVDGDLANITLPDGRTTSGRVLARDRDLDVAAVSVDAAGLPAVALGESKNLRPGHLVMACGHPWGVTGSVTFGTVIGIGNDLPEVPSGDRELSAVSLNLRPGNSGGPLMDTEGRLVGINTMMTGPEVGLAVPVHVVKRFLAKALGRRSAGQ